MTFKEFLENVCVRDFNGGQVKIKPNNIQQKYISLIDFAKKYGLELYVEKGRCGDYFSNLEDALKLMEEFKNDIY